MKHDIAQAEGLPEPKPKHSVSSGDTISKVMLVESHEVPASASRNRHSLCSLSLRLFCILTVTVIPLSWQITILSAHPLTMRSRFFVTDLKLIALSMMLSLAWGQCVNHSRVALLALSSRSYVVTAERLIHLVCTTTTVTSIA